MENNLNIAFLFAWMPDEKWSTPISIVNESKRRNIKGRIYSLYDRNKQYTAAGLTALYQHIQSGEYKPDILFHMDYGAFDHPLLDKQYFPNTYMVLEAGDDPQRFNYNSPKSHKFDLVLTPDLVSLNEYLKGDINAIYWTHFADAEEGKENESIKPIYDLVSTRGDGDTPFLDKIKSVLGNRFLNKRDYNILQRDILSSGKIVIQNSRYGEVTRRLFEGMYCNRMVMTDRLPVERGLELLFEDGKDIVYYDSFEDAIEKINYYSSNEAERLRIARNGYQKVLNNHTTVQRLDAVIGNYHKFIDKK
jgi:glycosyltransferase involved in cell wall biosynthesis